MTVAADVDLNDALVRYRSELIAYCYRMLGSSSEAEDAVQDTMLRAWRGFERYEGRASIRAWLYRIATNVCLDMLRGRTRRALPMDLAPAVDGPAPLGAPLELARWVEPIPDSMITSPEHDPAEMVTSRDNIRVAFVSALQHLLPRQRAVLVLRDVLRWKADEVADLLDTSVDAVNSTLRRARAALEAANLDPLTRPVAAVEQSLLDRYVDAFERLDIDTLVDLLREDATVCMPPFVLWLAGREAFRRWLTDAIEDCAESRLVPIRANGCPAVAVYRATEHNGVHHAFAIHVLEPTDNQIAAIHVFLEPAMFDSFGLPARLD